MEGRTTSEILSAMRHRWTERLVHELLKCEADRRHTDRLLAELAACPVVGVAEGEGYTVVRVPDDLWVEVFDR